MTLSLFAIAAPDAVDNVKKLFKGLFRRGKNKKQDKPAEQQAPSTSTEPSTAAATQQTPAATNGSAPNVDKPLPPTQPAQAAPPTEAKKEDTPQTQTAQPGAVESAQEGKKEADSQAVSPPSATPALTSQPVSAVEQTTPPPPPPKTEGDADVPKTAEVPKAMETTGMRNKIRR